MEIEKALKDEFEKVVKSGFIEEKITESLKKLMNSVIHDTIDGYNSNFKKTIKEMLEVALNTTVKTLTIPEYHTKILSVVQDEIDMQLSKEIETSLKERVKDFFQPIENREYKVTEIVEMFKESIKYEFTDENDYMHDSHEFTAFVDGSGSGAVDGYFYLMLDQEEEKSKYSCDYRISINKTGIWGISTGKDEDMLKSSHFRLSKFERFLFQAYSQKIIIIDDSKNIDNYIYSDCD